MTPYKTKAAPLSGTSYAEVAPEARKVLHTIARRTKRRPYIRFAYFRNDKVFISYFWNHLLQKNWRDRARRLQYLPCGIELIRKSHNAPYTYKARKRPHEAFHRFIGQAPDKTYFAVQIKENQRTGRKEFMLVFPIKNPPPM